MSIIINYTRPKSDFRVYSRVKRVVNVIPLARDRFVGRKITSITKPGALFDKCGTFNARNNQFVITKVGPVVFRVLESDVNDGRQRIRCPVNGGIYKIDTERIFAR